MKREEGILELALHSEGGPLVFNGYVHEALVKTFRVSVTIPRIPS